MPRDKMRTVQVHVVAKYLYAGQTWVLLKSGAVFRVNKNRIAMRAAPGELANNVQDKGKLLWSELSQGVKEATSEQP
jgi:hypothetical protein